MASTEFDYVGRGDFATVSQQNGIAFFIVCTHLGDTRFHVTTLANPQSLANTLFQKCR